MAQRSTYGSIDYGRNSNSSDYDYLMNKYEMTQSKLVQLSNVNEVLKNENINLQKIVGDLKDDVLREKLNNQKLQGDVYDRIKQR